jgi:hypothetical protein
MIRMKNSEMIIWREIFIQKDKPFSNNLKSKPLSKVC